MKRRVIQEKDGRSKDRLQFLYGLKMGTIKTLSQAAKWLGRHRNTISEWLVKYETGGLSQLLDRQTSPGGPPSIKGEVLEKLTEKLDKPEGFNSYGDIQRWLKEVHGCEVSYAIVFRVCHDQLKASPKVPRPRNPKQDPAQVEAFKKTSLKLSKLSRMTIANI